MHGVEEEDRHHTGFVLQHVLEIKAYEYAKAVTQKGSKPFSFLHLWLKTTQSPRQRRTKQAAARALSPEACAAPWPLREQSYTAQLSTGPVSAYFSLLEAASWLQLLFNLQL